MNLHSNKHITFISYCALTLFLITAYDINSSDTPKLTPVPGAAVAGCYLEHYREVDSSLYIQPFEVNKTYYLSQGNCGWITHQPKCLSISPNGVKKLCGDLRYSYDFDIPIGDNIIAARGGVVYGLVERYRNNSSANGQENYVTITHEDGTVASYSHLSPDGVLVEVGDRVTQGQVIGIAGNSGYTGGNPAFAFSCTSSAF